MKAIVKKLVVVALMFGTLITNGNNNAKENNTSKVSNVIVEFTAAKKGQVLSIRNLEGTSVYSAQIEKNGAFSKTFDLSHLAEGNYTTELEKEFEIIVKSFSISKGLVTFEDNVEKVFKPIIRTENNLVLISKIAFNKEPLKVNLYYGDEMIYKETVTDAKSILNRVYRVSEQEKGAYTVVIKSNNRSFTKNFNL
ncbi:hypothetical protein [uncultured Polaribacter sp.]|uniref:hypothetical protein n=1 Tax=uncultured Polaribacter sp. TaxID=174711 RepID=UPI00262B969A|nr:hypothetical protein [uncultured Polaribacter sp.]